MSVKTEIPRGTSSNFQTIKDAIRSDRIALLRAYDKLSGKDVTLICAMNLVADKYEFVPIAVMIEDNPFERFEPPK